MDWIEKDHARRTNLANTCWHNWIADCPVVLCDGDCNHSATRHRAMVGFGKDAHLHHSRPDMAFAPAAFPDLDGDRQMGSSSKHQRAVNPLVIFGLGQLIADLDDALAQAS